MTDIIMMIDGHHQKSPFYCVPLMVCRLIIPGNNRWLIGCTRRFANGYLLENGNAFMIIIVFGLPGSGKSFFAKRLAGVLQAVYLNSDIIRKKMFTRRTYSDNEKSLVYDEMLNQITKAAETHKTVVVDATFYTDKLRQKFIEGTKQFGALIFIEVQSEEPLIKTRLETPRAESEADFGIYQKLKQLWEPLTDDHLILRSRSTNIQDMLDTTTDYLRHKNDNRTDQ